MYHTYPKISEYPMNTMIIELPNDFPHAYLLISHSRIGFMSLLLLDLYRRLSQVRLE